MTGRAFIDTKVKRYYSKSLLKEALESQEVKCLESVRYKANVNVQVGLCGINGTLILQI